jgi:hypothetical protein
MTKKKGHALLGAEFISDDFHDDMLHTKKIRDADEDAYEIGWLEFKDCEKINPEQPTTTIPSTPVYGTSEQEFLDALRIVVRFLKEMD